MDSDPPDWMSFAASEAEAYLAGKLSLRFGSKSWTEFSNRLSAHGERLFRLLHRLFGWRYDFAWIYEQMIDVAAEGYLGRPRALRKIDRRSATPPAWLSDSGSLVAMAYLDRYASTVKGLRDRFDHLTSLGASHLHLLPPHGAPAGPAHTGLAVSDYRRLVEGLGTAQQLAKIASELRRLGVTLVLDLTAASTASDHPLAKAAANPDILAAIAGEMLFLANIGAGAIRIDGAPLLWKQAGASCENLPEAHVIVQILQTITRIVAPSVVLVSETMLPGRHDATFMSQQECLAGYNSLLMSSVWEALAAADTRLLARALGDRYRPPEGCTWISYLRGDDEIGWWFADEDALALGIDPYAHRRFLSAFYQDRGAGVSRRGRVDEDPSTAPVSGTVATLAGLEAAVARQDPAATEVAVRRVLAAFAVVLGAGGVPMLFLGDEIAQLFDRPCAAEAALGPDDAWRPFFDVARLQSAEAGEGPHGAVLAGLRGLLDIRRGLDGFGPQAQPEPFELGDRALIGFRRGPALVVVNMSERPVIVARPALPAGELFDLITDDVWAGHLLGPYEYRYLLSS